MNTSLSSFATFFLYGWIYTFISSNVIAQTKSESEIYPATSSRADVDAVAIQRSKLQDVHFPTFGDECTRDLVTLGIDKQWGRVSGMNGFGDREKAQKLTFTDGENYRVVEAMIWFERPALVGDGTINAKIYTVDPANGQPDRLVGLSNAVKASEIVVSDSVSFPTIFSFDQGAQVLLDEPSFFVSCDFTNLYQSFDTVVILQTIDGCGDGGNSWELFSDGQTWTNIASSISWEVDADFIMAAVVDFDDPTGTEAYVSSGDLTLYPAYPNPAEGKFYLNYELKQPKEIQIDLFTAQGKNLISVPSKFKSAGKYQEEVSTHHLSPGIYYYRLRSIHGEVTSRIIIN